MLCLTIFFLSIALWQCRLACAKTVVEIFADYDCKESLGPVQTSLVAVQGDCIAVPKGAHSVRPTNVDSPCSGVLHHLEHQLDPADRL